MKRILLLVVVLSLAFGNLACPKEGPTATDSQTDSADTADTCPGTGPAKLALNFHFPPMYQFLPINLTRVLEVTFVEGGVETRISDPTIYLEDDLMTLYLGDDLQVNVLLTPRQQSSMSPPPARRLPGGRER